MKKLIMSFLIVLLVVGLNLGSTTAANGVEPPALAHANSNQIAATCDGFACGQDLICNPSTHYCYVLIGGPKGVPPSYSCVDLSDEGSWPTCETIPNIGVGCECAESDCGITVTCTAP